MYSMKYQTERTKQVLCRGEYKGFNFVIVSYGTHPCAYVEIPKSHPLYETDYDCIDIDCHGGLTFDGDLLFVDDSLKGWYIGWDYAHPGDYVGYMLGVYEDLGTPCADKKWKTEEIYEEVKKVIEQISNYKKKGANDMVSDEMLIINALKGHIRVNEKLGIIEIYDEYGTKSVLRDVDYNTLEAFKTYFQIF